MSLFLASCWFTSALGQEFQEYLSTTVAEAGNLEIETIVDEFGRTCKDYDR